MRCDGSPQAFADLRVIGDFIARDNPERAPSFVAELLIDCLRLAEQPDAYPARPELGQDLRSWAHKRQEPVARRSPPASPQTPLNLPRSQ